MAIEPIDAGRHLQQAVARARQIAEAAGELRATELGPYRSPLPPEAAEAILELLRDGTYAAAAARVAAEDPDLADG